MPWRVQTKTSKSHIFLHAKHLYDQALLLIRRSLDLVITNMAIKKLYSIDLRCWEFAMFFKVNLTSTLSYIFHGKIKEEGNRKYRDDAYFISYDHRICKKSTCKKSCMHICMHTLKIVQFIFNWLHLYRSCQWAVG